VPAPVSTQGTAASTTALFPSPLAPVAAGRWSAPAAAGSCSATGAPRVLFPSDRPDHATGPGALVWSASAGCPGGQGARVDQLLPGALPGPASIPRSAAGAPLGALSAADGPHGQIVISGVERHNHELLVQGRAGGSFKALLQDDGLLGPGTLTSAYLGDVALLAPLAGAGPGALGLSVERWFANAVGPLRPARRPARSSASALTVAMDFRSDALVAWAQAGGIWVRDLPARGGARAPQRLGPAGSDPHLTALLSDDNRGIVMWSEQRGSATSVWMDFSATGPRFGPPQLLERDVDPSAPPAGSPQLIRLSSESVMSAWGGVQDGRWVLRTAPIDQHGLRSISTTAAPDGDALLDALAPGPRGEAIALLSEPQTGTGEALLAARGIEAAGRTYFDAPEVLAPAGPVSGATVAIEPAGDRAVAAWQGAGGVVHYSLRAP
jgi:hypothetical protein